MLILTIWPLFAMICLGYVLHRTGFPGAAFWPAAERINYFVLFPALLVVSLADAPVQDPALIRLGGAAVTAITLAVLVMVLARLLRPTPAARFGPAVQGVIRFNTYIGLALVAALSGPVGLDRAAVFLAIAVPVVNVVSIMALTEGNLLRRPGLLIRTVVTNPLIIACVVGFTLGLSGLGLPYGSGAFLALMGQASLPLGLLCVGAALRPSAMGRYGLGLIGVDVLRLLVMPVVAAGIAALFALGPVDTLVLVVFCGIPTATTAYVLTQQLGGDGTYMAGLVTSQTLAAVVTVPLMLGLLGLG